MPRQTNTQPDTQSNRQNEKADQPDDNPESQTPTLRLFIRLLLSFRLLFLRRNVWVQFHVRQWRSRWWGARLFQRLGVFVWLRGAILERRVATIFEVGSRGGVGCRFRGRREALKDMLED